MKCAVIVHIFYYDIADELAEAVKNICDVEKDIFLTVSESILDRTDEIAKKFPGARINIVKNVGYDIWPFLFILNQLELDQYDLIVKLHTKRNMPEGTSMKKVLMPYDSWRKNLLSFAKTEDTFRKSLSLIRKKEVGIVSGRNCLLSKRYDGETELYQFIEKFMGECAMSYKPDFQFVAGTMFVGKAYLFEYLKNRFQEGDFREADNEHKKQELPHVLERVFGYAIGAQGHKVINCFGKGVEYEASVARIKRFLFRRQYTTHHIITRILGIPFFVRKYSK